MLPLYAIKVVSCVTWACGGGLVDYTLWKNRFPVLQRHMPLPLLYDFDIPKIFHFGVVMISSIDQAILHITSVPSAMQSTIQKKCSRFSMVRTLIREQRPFLILNSNIFHLRIPDSYDAKITKIEKMVY